MTGFDPTLFLRNLAWLKPELLLALVGFVLLALALVLPRELRRWAGLVAVVGLVTTGFLVAGYLPGAPWGTPKVEPGVAALAFPNAAGEPAFVLDGFALVFKAIFLLGAALCVLLSVRFLDEEDAQGGEYYALVVFSVLGMMFLASGKDLITLYIGLETMALASYVLVGFTRRRLRSNEAALKYFLLGAFSSAILIYGISLVYGTTGSFHLSGIAAALRSGAAGPRGLLETGAILILVGLAFKVASVPFHMWVPDAYEGAPTPITAFISTAAKAAGFALLLRVFLVGFVGLAGDWIPLLALLSVASMTLGNVTAVLQDNVKRMLAYSSIGHAGYMLMGVLVAGAAMDDPSLRSYGMTAVALYLLVYTFANMGAFGMVVFLRRGKIGGDRIEDFRGLSATHPVAAAAMAIFLLSLAGIPCTAGFIGKWWLFAAAIKANFAWLAVVAVVNSTISLYYYMRVVVAMYMKPVESREPVPAALGITTALAVAFVFTLWIGVYPQPFIRFARLAALPLLGG